MTREMPGDSRHYAVFGKQQKVDSRKCTVYMRDRRQQTPKIILLSEVQKSCPEFGNDCLCLVTSIDLSWMKEKDSEN